MCIWRDENTRSANHCYAGLPKQNGLSFPGMENNHKEMNTLGGHSNRHFQCDKIIGSKQSFGHYRAVGLIEMDGNLTFPLKPCVNRSGDIAEIDAVELHPASGRFPSTG